MGMRHTVRWVAVGGMVRSRRTGERVYADPRNLARAYGLRPGQCALVDTRRLSDTQARSMEARIARVYEGLPVLRPRDAGDYVEERRRLEKEFGYGKK